MGWFSSKTKHYVDTQVARVVEDESVPNTLKNAIVTGLFQEDQSPATSILNAALRGPGRQFESMYRYAKRGGYVYGLPDITVRHSMEGNDVARNVVETKIENKPVDIKYVFYRGLNNTHMAWKELVETYDINKNTYEMRSLYEIRQDSRTDEQKANNDPRPYPDANLDKRVFLDKIISYHKLDPENLIDPQSLGVWGNDYTDNIANSFNPGIADVLPGGDTTDLYEAKLGDEEGFEILCHWIKRTAVYETLTQAELDEGKKPRLLRIDEEKIQESFYHSLESWDQNLEYFHICYTYEETVGDITETIWRYRIYDPATNNYPELNEIYESYVDSNEATQGSYFPFAILISRGTEEKRVDRTIDDGSEAFKSTKKLLKYLTLDIEEIGKALRGEVEDDDTPENEKQSMEDIQQAIMMMGVPMASSDPIDIEYLYRYFDNIHKTIYPDGEGEGTNYSETAGLNGGITEKMYALEIGDADYKTVISFDRITKKIIEGQLTDSDNNPLKVGAFDADDLQEDLDAMEDVPGISRDVLDEIRRATRQLKHRTFRKQITAESYIEITVHNPQFKTTVKTVKNGRKSLDVEGGVDDERLLIPVDFNITKSISYFDRERLYMRSFHFVFNSYVKQKIKWYQRGAFAVLMVVVAVVLTFYLGPVGTKFGTVMAKAGFAAAVSAVLVPFIVKFVITSIIFNLAFKFVVKKLGIEAAIILAVIALAVGGYKAIRNIAVDGLKEISASALRYLNVASGLSGGIQSEIARKMGVLQEEYNAWMEEAKDELEELNRMQAELRGPVDLDPLLFLRRSQPMIIIGEEPNLFYNRMIGNTNPGVQSLDFIDYFYKAAVSLPKTSV